jgi:DNA-directed RNA polymerase specialized sigma24 family protein
MRTQERAPVRGGRAQASTARTADACREDLVERTIGGDGRAWRALWLAVEATLHRITARFRVTSRLSHSDDERRNIVLRVMGQLHADGFRRLRLYRASRERRGEGTFHAWLSTMAVRSAISYVRAHPEYLGRPSPDDHRRGRWAEVLPLGAEVDARMVDPTRTVEARALLALARRQLREDQLEALLLWLEGREHGEIAALLSLGDVASAERLVRSALKRLRDRLAKDEDGEGGPSTSSPSAAPASSARSGSASTRRGSPARPRSRRAGPGASGALRR